MKFVFRAQLIFSIFSAILYFVTAIIRRYQPLFLAVCILLLIIFAAVFESLYPLIQRNPEPVAYEVAAAYELNSAQLQKLLKEWQEIAQLQPNSLLVASQVAQLKTALENTQK